MLRIAPKTSFSISKFENPTDNLCDGSLKRYIFSEHLWYCASFSEPFKLSWCYSDKILTLFRTNIPDNSEFCLKLNCAISFENWVSATLKSTFPLHKKWSSLRNPLRISSVNVSKPQFPADLVTFTGEILNGKLHFSCSVYIFGAKRKHWIKWLILCCI